MEHKFEPFEKVLVRDSDSQRWCCDLFSILIIDDKDSRIWFACVGRTALQCIPYEGNEHFLGTTDSPEQKHEYKWGDKVEVRPKDTWVKALYYKAVEDAPFTGETFPHQHKVVGYNGVYGNLYDFIFHDKDIRPLAEDSDALQKS